MEYYEILKICSDVAKERFWNFKLKDEHSMNINTLLLMFRTDRIRYASFVCVCACECRFGLGRFTTKEEVDFTAEKCITHVTRLREMR